VDGDRTSPVVLVCFILFYSIAHVGILAIQSPYTTTRCQVCTNFQKIVILSQSSHSLW